MQFIEQDSSDSIIIAATNNQKLLDQALFRRFDESFEMVKPSLREIENVLKMTLSSIETKEKFNWIDLADKMQGMSYAEIVKVAQNSAKNIILKGKHVLDDKVVYSYINDVKQ